jgi:hypothetical protein
MQHAAAGGHAARRNHNRRLYGWPSVPSIAVVTTRSEIVWSQTSRRFFSVRRISSSSSGDARRIEPQRLRWPSGYRRSTGTTGNATLLLETPHPVEQLLDAADGKRRNDQLAAALDGAANDLRQFLTVIILDMIASP